MASGLSRTKPDIVTNYLSSEGSTISQQIHYTSSASKSFFGVRSQKTLQKTTRILSEVSVKGQSWCSPKSQAQNRQIQVGHASSSKAAPLHPHTCPFYPGSSTPRLVLDFPAHLLKPPANSHTSLESWPQGYYVCYHPRDCSFLNLGIYPKGGGVVSHMKHKG